MRANQNLRKVSIDRFDADMLREAARQGRLYLAAPAEVSEEQCRTEVLRYVSRIHPCAAPPYAGRIGRLWQDIVAHPAFAGCWHIRRGKNMGQPNRSFVTAVADYLRLRGVYTATYTTQLHFLLEGVTRKNAVYNNMAQYPTSRAQRKAVGELLENFRGDS